MSSSGLHLENFRIPLEEIILATKNFSRETLIGAGGFSRIYKGKFSERFQNRTAAIKRHKHDGYHGTNEFLNQLKLLITFQHENIIPFIGYCDEGDEMITVIEYAINGSLDYHLKNTIKRRELTWVQRLKICIGVARGLNYLHTGLGEDKVVIHRMINRGSILLDENLEAKITGFSLLTSVPRDQANVYEPSAVGIWHYLDPIYHESGIMTAEADVYSFGIVLFEILTGMLAHYTKEIGDAKRQHMINLVRRYYDDGLDKLIDPFIKDQIVRRSLLTFEEMAYKCISFNTKDRPTMDKIIKTAEEALNTQNRGTASAFTIRAHQYQNLQKFIFPLEKIKSATYNFSPEFLIKDGFTKVYRGEIFVGFQLHVVAFKRYDPNNDQENEEFRNELEMISRSQHKNIIPFIGFCDEGGEMIIIYEYAVNGSLKRHLQDPDRRRCITWAQRLKICIGAATGLSYLHSGLGHERDKVIHRNFKSGKILLGHNLEAKISGFDMSILVPKDQRQVYEPVEGTQFYIDPIYQECGILQKESDTYSFGMVLFEILSGMLAYHKRSIGVEQPQILRNLVRRYYDDGPENLIDSLIRDQIDDRSFRLFTEIAYKCMSFNMEDRPSMKRVIKRIMEALDIQNQRDASTFNIRSIQPQQQEDFRIPLEEIKKAIQKFGEHIGSGGFGTVYKGQLSERWNNRTAAIKCLDLNNKQGKNEFYNELNLISRFHHENIVTFIGYCDEDGEMIFVYEYAINGSLDSHLEHPKKDRPITWAERLKICIGAGRGLKYLHLGGEDNNTVVHRDVKSGNILLDENFEAKICDFGLSKSGPDDQPHSKFYTKAAGTRYYIDPSYQESGILRKESDVYSFGVVMFELLTGIPAWHQRRFGDGKPQILINLVRRYYDNGLDELIDPRLKYQIDNRSSHKFIEIAYEQGRL